MLLRLSVRPSVCLSTSVALSPLYFVDIFSARYRTAFPLDERDVVTARCDTGRQVVDAVCQSQCTWMRPSPFSRPTPAMPVRSRRRRFPQCYRRKAAAKSAQRKKLLTVTDTTSNSDAKNDLRTTLQTTRECVYVRSRVKDGDYTIRYAVAENHRNT